MLEGLANRLYKLLRTDHLENTSDALMIYGISKILDNLISLLILLFAAYVLKTMLQTIVILISFNCIRRFAHGVHANSLLQCKVISIIVFVLLVPFISKLALSSMTALVLGTVCLLLVIIYAPSDTQKNPIYGVKSRRQLKIKAVISSCVAMSLAILIDYDWMRVCILYGMIIAIILILPTTFYCLNQRRNESEEIKP